MKNKTIRYAKIKPKAAQRNFLTKKTKRKKGSKELYKNFSIYYSNIRGIKSKIKSLKQIIEEKQPTVICIAETHLKESDQIMFKGYSKPFRNDRSAGKGGGGVLIAVKEKLRGVTIEVDRVNDTEETLWVLIKNRKTKLRVGIVYAPQETRTGKDELVKMYERIEKSVNIGRQQDENIIITGDFNAKIAIKKGQETQESSVAGRILEKLEKQNKLYIINRDEKTKGFYTRSEGGSKSMIDYVIIEKTNKSKFVEATVDEKRNWTPYYIEKGKEVYTDHFSIIAKFKWIEEERKTKMKQKSENFSKENIRIYKQLTNGKVLQKIANENKPLNKRYKEWEKTIKLTAKKTFTKITKNKYTGISKKLKRLMQKRRRCRAEGDEEKVRRLNLQIEEEISKEEANKGQKVAESIVQEGGVNNPAFWKILKQPKKENDVATAMKNSQGVLKTGRDEVIKIYQNHFKELLQTKKASDERGRNVEENVERCFRMINTVGKQVETNAITEEELRRATRKLKKKKASDIGGMKGEYIIYAGDDLIKSLLILLNGIIKTGEIPEKWKRMKIKSIYKRKGSRNEMKNQRGIFITNIVSKVFERVLLNRNREDIEQSMSPFQCGGRKQRGVTDHLFTLKSMIEEYKEKKKTLYVFYGDLEKCFDQLWLKDSIVELFKTGMNPREVMLIYSMNETCYITVETPLGNAKEIEVSEIVRQGTIWGPTLCSITTDKINEMGEKQVTRYGNTKIEPMIFVDDICAVGEEEDMGVVGRNCTRLEDQKKMTFNNEKSNYQMIGKGKAKKKKELTVPMTVKKGVIERTETYKYLGEVINEKGTNDDTIKKKERKAKSVTLAIQKLSHKAGFMRNSVAEKLIKTTLLPILTYGTETWPKMSKREEQEMEKIQKDALYQIYGMKRSTPYEAFLSEIGVLTINNQIKIKKLMLFFDLKHSDDSRIAKQILLEQERKESESSWWGQIQEITNEFEIEGRNVNDQTRSEWKREVTKRISERMNEQMKECTKTKSRFLKTWGRKGYITKLRVDEAKRVLETRLNMLPIAENFKGTNDITTTRCEKCNEKLTTEHIFECIDGENQDNVTVDDMKSEDIEKLKLVSRHVKKFLEN